MKVLLFGGAGLLGSELAALFAAEKVEFLAPARRDADCRDPQQVLLCIRSFKPTAVVVAAGRLGGISANMRKGEDFLLDNALINLTTLRACAEERVPQAMIFGSSCMYPRDIDRPIAEEDLLQGPLEMTSQGYAVGKLAGVVYAGLLSRAGKCRATVCVPTNLYGDRDCFDAENGHLVGSLIAKMHRAKEEGRDTLELWGDGSPRRDFLHASDAARACLLILRSPESPWIINVGTGSDLTVKEIAREVAAAVGYGGEIRFAGAVPNGTSRKLLNSDRIRALGWEPRVPLADGLRRAYASFLTSAGAPLRVR